MSLTNVTSVFSRLFIVGFFLPPFFALLLLWQTLSTDFPPNRLHYSDPGNVAVLGGIALLLGLFLFAYEETVEQLLAGEAFLSRRTFLYHVLLRWQLRRFTSLEKELADPSTLPVRRTKVFLLLDQYFPHEEHLVGPTRLANTKAATDSYTFTRWGLEHREAWPRIQALLSGQEQELHADAKTDVAFFLNAAMLTVVASAVYLADFIAFRRHSSPQDWWWLAPSFSALAAAYFFYRSGVGRAAERAARVRGSVDLHRLELYEKVGLRRPTSSKDEKELAGALNNLLLYRRDLPGASWPSPVPPSGPAEAPQELAGLGHFRLVRIQR
jgi:hypothetical protein